MFRKILTRFGVLGTIALAAVALLVLAQVVPYGRSHANPRPTRELRFDSARTQQLFAGACADCHSDRTTWPWYSNVAPVSWLVQRDVNGGRGILDVSRWDGSQAELHEIVEVVQEGEMPPLQYKAIHGAARLTAAERRDLADGLRRSYESDPPGR